MSERSDSNVPMLDRHSSKKDEGMTEVDGIRPRVVVIDADGDVRALLETMLEVADGFELLAVTADVDRGVKDAAAYQPDAIVVDLDLPNLDGVEVIARLRGASPASRIIVFSAFPDPLTLLEVLRQGADEYLDKARTWADLLPTIELLCATPRRLRRWPAVDIC
jgi:DNA-binding NarL/FixJ family response regulator